MKRAWPYALALAVVVTGCYLALAPLLRSLSPAPTSSATSQLSSNGDTITVGKQPTAGKVVINGGVKGTTSLVSLNAVKKKTKKKVKKTTTVAPTTRTTPTDSSSGFAAGSSSSSSSSSNSGSSTSDAPKAPVKTVQKTVPKKGPATVGGAVQSPTGDSGLAGGTDSASSDFGQKPDVGGG